MPPLKQRRVLLTITLFLILCLLNSQLTTFSSSKNSPQQSDDDYFSREYTLTIETQNQLHPELNFTLQTHNRQPQTTELSSSAQNKTQTSFLGTIHHPKAPISELSNIESKVFLEPDMSFCQLEEDNQKVSLIIVLNRLSGVTNRASIRSTFGSFSSFEEQVRFNWKIIFLTGRPTSEDSEQLLMEESRMFRDILAANLPDEYNNVPILKQLICFEYLTQNCHSINYLVKIDDDVYVRLPKLEKAIEGTQNLANKRIKNDSEKGKQVSLYTGLACGKFNVHRNGYWWASKEEYALDKWPHACGGPLVVYSYDMIQSVSDVCPYHCIGLSNNSVFNASSPCLYRSEDIFLGSCICTMKDIHLFKETIPQSLGRGMKFQTPKQISGNKGRYYAIHTNINYGMKDQTNSSLLEKVKVATMKNEMIEIHNFYAKKVNITLQ